MGLLSADRDRFLARKAFEEKDQLWKAEFTPWLASVSPWTLFITVTFALPRPAYAAMSVLAHVHRVIDKGVEVRNLFLGTEPHKSSLLHVHGLLSTRWTLERAGRYYLWQNLFKTFGRSGVKLIYDKSGVADYVTKYVVKDLTEWQIW